MPSGAMVHMLGVMSRDPSLHRRSAHQLVDRWSSPVTLSLAVLSLLLPFSTVTCKGFTPGCTLPSVAGDREVAAGHSVSYTGLELLLIGPWWLLVITVALALGGLFLAFMAKRSGPRRGGITMIAAAA